MHYFFIIVIWLLSINTAWADCWLQAEKMFNIESETTLRYRPAGIGDETRRHWS